MKVYQLEFRFFCGVEWKEVNCTITAETKKQLNEAFIKTTAHVNEDYCGYAGSQETYDEQQKRLIDQCWEKNKNNIEQIDFSFPIIKLF